MSDDEIEIKVKQSIKERNLEELDDVVSELLQLENISSHVDLLNELLLINFHRQHQYIAKTIQSLKTPSSVPFIKKVLESKFKEIPYTGSDSYGMAKWFSWALYCIGTKEAVEVLKEHANSKDKGIRDEMRYRLKKLRSAKN
jgi:HEAT repeat protein